MNTRHDVNKTYIYSVIFCSPHYQWEYTVIKHTILLQANMHNYGDIAEVSVNEIEVARLDGP